MRTTLPDPTEAQHQAMDRIAVADDRDWDRRRRVKRAEMRGPDHIDIVLITTDGQEQTITPSGRLGSRGSRHPDPRYQTTRLSA